MEPKNLIVGFSYRWSRTFSKYPASTWSLSYTLYNEAHQVRVDAVANGDSFDVEFSQAVTTELPPGDYRLIGFVENGSERIAVFSTPICVIPDPLQTQDVLSHAEKVLSAVRAMIEKTASKDQQSIVVDGQTLVRRTVADLIALEDRYRRIVAREKRRAEVASGVRAPGRVQVRFK